MVANASEVVSSFLPKAQTPDTAAILERRALSDFLPGTQQIEQRTRY